MALQCDDIKKVYRKIMPRIHVFLKVVLACCAWWTNDSYELVLGDSKTHSTSVAQFMNKLAVFPFVSELENYCFPANSEVLWERYVWVCVLFGEPILQLPAPLSSCIIDHFAIRRKNKMKSIRKSRSADDYFLVMQQFSIFMETNVNVRS